MSRRQPPDWQWWFLAAVVPLVFCASKLNLDFWYDEAYTLQMFVSRPWIRIVTDYSAPNNHVLYSLVLRPFYLLSDSEFVLRLPSLLFSVGTLYLTFRLVRLWAGRAAAALATLWLGLSVMFLTHTMQLRGYGLSMCLAAWLGNLALWHPAVGSESGGAASGEPAGGGQTRAGVLRRGLRAVLIVAIGAAFLYVLPTNVLFLVPLAAVSAIWAWAQRRRFLQLAGEIGLWLAACLAAAAAYLPILDQVLQAGKGSGRVSLAATVQLAGAVFWAALRDVPPVVVLATVGLGLLVSRGKQTGIPTAVFCWLLLLLVLGPFVVTWAAGVHPFVRNFCPVLPFTAALWSVGLSYFLAVLGRRFVTGWNEAAVAVSGAALLLVVCLPALLTYPARLTEYRRTHVAQDGYFNYYAANYHPSRVVAYLRDRVSRQPAYHIFFARSDYFPLWLYFQREGVPLYRLPAASGQTQMAIYLITPPRPDYPSLSEISGLRAEQLRAFPLIRDFGYYRLYCWEPPGWSGVGPPQSARTGGAGGR